MMRRIGVRELRQNASAWLREVQAGATLEITDRGRPIALLTPLPGGAPRDRLIAEGRLKPGSGDLMELLKAHPPLPPMTGRPLASEILEQMRVDER
jgi:prevent-host-death family protein